MFVEFFAAVVSLGLWFWLIAVAAIITIGILTYLDKYAVGICVSLVTIALIEYVSKVSIVNYLKNIDGVYLAKFLFLYGIFCIVWAGFKFKMYAIDVRRELEVDLKRHMSVNNFTTGAKFKSDEIRDKIFTWLIFAPFSMIGTLIGDGIRKVYNVCYDAVAKLVEGVWNKTFESLKADVEKALNVKI